MADEGVTRRLAAIISADVAGYSRLMEADETGTLATLRAHRVVTDRVIAEHNGRIVGTAGDSLLVEFPSATEAVSCAHAVQVFMAERNADVAENKRMQFRIGVNLGDVMIEGTDVFGNGVNIAARLQELAEPGGIWMSNVVHDQVRHSLKLRYEDQGEHRVKNISEPVRSYRILSDLQEREEQPLPTHSRHSKRRWAIGGALSVCVIALALLGWFVFDFGKVGSDIATCKDHLGLPVPCPDDRQ